MAWHLAPVTLATISSTQVAPVIACTQAALEAGRQGISTSMMTSVACRGYGCNPARDLGSGGVHRGMVSLC